jgi:hypothetical protein
MSSDVSIIRDSKESRPVMSKWSVGNCVGFLSGAISHHVKSPSMQPLFTCDLQRVSSPALPARLNPFADADARAADGANIVSIEEFRQRRRRDA